MFLAWERLQILQRWSLTRHLAAVATVGLRILTSQRALTALFGLSAVIHLLTATVAWCVARSVGADLPLLYSVFLVLPVVLVTVVPISIAGWGVREGAMVAAFSYAGLPASDGLIVSLLFGASYLALGALGGLVWVLTADRRPQRDLRRGYRRLSAQSLWYARNHSTKRLVPSAIGVDGRKSTSRISRRHRHRSRARRPAASAAVRCLFADRLLEQADHFQQFDRAVVADVVDAPGRVARARIGRSRRPLRVGRRRRGRPAARPLRRCRRHR